MRLYFWIERVGECWKGGLDWRHLMESCSVRKNVVGSRRGVIYVVGSGRTATGQRSLESTRESLDVTR